MLLRESGRWRKAIFYTKDPGTCCQRQLGEKGEEKANMTQTPSPPTSYSNANKIAVKMKKLYEQIALEPHKVAHLQ